MTFNSLVKGKAKLKVFDMIGKELINEDIDVLEGENSREMNLENTAKGIYFVTIQSEGDRIQTIRLLIQ